MFPVVEFIRISVGRTDFPQGGAQTQGRPGEGAQVQGLACGHGDIRLFEGTDHAGAKCPEVVGAGQNIGDGETTTRSRLDPELIGQVLLLKIHSAIHRR
jgi:hypothetical protein